MKWRQRIYLVFPMVLFCLAASPAAPGPIGGGAYRGLNPIYGREKTADAVTGYFHALEWLKKQAADLEKKHGERLPKARELLQQIQKDSAFLQQKWLAWPQRHPGQAAYSGDLKLDKYFRTLQGLEKELKKLSKADDDQILLTVKAVADDLHAKAENCRYSADGLGKNIKVTVHTRQGTAEAPGFEVFCAPVALVKFKNEHVRFPRISSPTVYQNLPPGHYAMWLQKGKLETPPVAQTIGGRGETEIEIDLPVPSDLVPAP